MSATDEVYDKSPTPHAPSVVLISKALGELGQSWRNSWADFDGRTLRDQMDSATDLLDRATAGEDVVKAAEALVEEFTFNRGEW